MLSQTKIQHSFQRALASYNDHAIVQKKSALTLLSHLVKCDIKPKLTRVFEFGCGTGFLTLPLTQRFTISELIANDIVEECHNYLSRSDLKFIIGDIDKIAIPSNCDLICSASYAQWSTDLEGLIERITASLNEDGYMAISSFSEGQFKELTLLEEQAGLEPTASLNYWPEQTWKEHLKSDYEVEIITKEQTCLWFDSVRELLLHLRLTGVNGNAGQTWNKRSLSEFETNYRDNFEVNGKVPLSYEPIYIIARKRALRS